MKYVLKINIFYFYNSGSASSGLADTGISYFKLTDLYRAIPAFRHAAVGVTKCLVYSKSWNVYVINVNGDRIRSDHHEDTNQGTHRIYDRISD